MNETLHYHRHPQCHISLGEFLAAADGVAAYLNVHRHRGADRHRRVPFANPRFLGQLCSYQGMV